MHNFFPGARGNSVGKLTKVLLNFGEEFKSFRPSHFPASENGLSNVYLAHDRRMWLQIVSLGTEKLTGIVFVLLQKFNSWEWRT